MLLAELFSLIGSPVGLRVAYVELEYAIEWFGAHDDLISFRLKRPAENCSGAADSSAIVPWGYTRRPFMRLATRTLYSLGSREDVEPADLTRLCQILVRAWFFVLRAWLVPR